jgi:hypothetical protein
MFRGFSKESFLEAFESKEEFGKLPLDLNYLLAVSEESTVHVTS